MDPNVEEETALQNEEYETIIVCAAAAAAACVAAEFVIRPTIRNPYRGESLRGQSETMRIISVSDLTCRAQIRMTRNAFSNLCATVRERGLLTNSAHLTVEEQLCMFLYTIGHNGKNRQIVNLFSRSGQTVSQYFHAALNAILKLWKSLLPPLTTQTPMKIREAPGRYYPYFKDCIGAIDGTHVPAWVPTSDHRRFRDRHGCISQNVLGACDFDMNFSYVLAGWEGSTSDSRILDDALNRAGEAKLLVPHGRYYLVDAGFANKRGFLRPYRNVRYHLKEWRNCNQTPANAKELYNMRHSQLRNVIERAFGVLKARFKILKNQPEYEFRTQVKIVAACSLMHNYIIRHGRMDDDEEFFAQEDAAIATARVGPTVTVVDEEEEEDDMGSDNEEDDENPIDWDQFRDNLADQMWNDWVAGEAMDDLSDSE